MKICHFECGPIGTNCFVIVSNSNSLVAIDAAEDAFDEVQSFAKKNKLTIDALLLTHPHWDHVWDAKKFQDAGIKVYAHKNACPVLADPKIQSSFMMSGMQMSPVIVDKPLNDGDVLNFGDFFIDVFLAEGHCVGSAVYSLRGFDAAFVGDVIFAGSVGRYDLPTGDFAKLQKSIKEKIYTLPDSTVLYPGHGPSTSVKYEKTSNPYVRG